MSTLDKFSDEELFTIFDADIEEEIKSRGYEYGWHKKVEYVGVIYILVNPAFPKLVKIGYTDDIAKRVKSLSNNSGVPDPYHIYATYKVKKRLEDLKLHKLIDSLDSSLRHTTNKEFYEMSPAQAFGILSAIAEINGDEDLLVKNPMADDFFDETTTDRTDKEKPEKPDKKRERLTFAMLGLPVGTKLIYKDDPAIVVEVADAQSGVNYNGNVYKMSTLVRMLKNGGSWQGGEHFLYHGQKLTDIRKKIEEKGFCSEM